MNRWASEAWASTEVQGNHLSRVLSFLNWVACFFLINRVLVLISVKTGLSLDFFIVTIKSACPTVWGIGEPAPKLRNLHQTSARRSERRSEEEPCPSAVGSMSPRAVQLVEEEVFDRFSRLISVEGHPIFALMKFYCFAHFRSIISRAY